MRFRIVRATEAAQMFGVSLTQIKVIAATDKSFPPMYVLSERCFGWRSDELASWMNRLPVSSRKPLGLQPACEDASKTRPH